MKTAIVMFSLLVPSILLGLMNNAWSRQVSTTRLKSTAGTGVATLLMDEATVLNPSAISFFQVSSFYLQKGSSDVTSNSTSPLAPTSEDELLFIASDAKGTVDGSVSYAQTKDKLGKATRLATSMSSPIGEKSALGFSYAMSKQDGPLGKAKYNQISAGVTHAVVPAFTIGLVLPDILGEKVLERRAIAGGQYVYKDFVAVMFDAGADWEREVRESSLIRAAIQLKVFSDFYMRFGAVEDRGMKSKGSGFGIGWVQPRLVIDVALSRTEYSELPELNQVNETAKETSFALSYRF